MFIGTYEHTIDEKSRLTLPARFRDALGDGVVLARGLDGNVAVYPRETWRMTVEARISVLDPLSREARDLAGSSSPAPPRPTSTARGASSCAATLSRHAGLDREVVVTGNYDHLELWNPPAWEKHLNAVEGSVEHAAERLATHGS